MSSSCPSSLLTTNSNLFGPPPPHFSSIDPLNPNPLVMDDTAENVEHFKLMSRGTVEEIRLLGCQIIESGVKLLKMSHTSLYTAQILFNQFYARESFLDFPLMDTLMACVFVAGKVEECIRRARDIVNVFHHLYCLIRKLPAGPIDYVGDIYYIWRDRLCTAESLLLRELGFHVQPASPVNLLLSYLKTLELEQHSNVPQTALNYLNDALKTEAYIRFQPRIIAVSAISLSLDRLNSSAQLLPHPNTLQSPWFTLFDVNETELIECKQIIMSIYNRELDTLLPLTREELSIFSSSIRPEKVEISGDSKEVRNTDKSRDFDHMDGRSVYADIRYGRSVHVDYRDVRSSSRDRDVRASSRDGYRNEQNYRPRDHNSSHSHSHSHSDSHNHNHNHNHSNDSDGHHIDYSHHERSSHSRSNSRSLYN